MKLIDKLHIFSGIVFVLLWVSFLISYTMIFNQIFVHNDNNLNDKGKYVFWYNENVGYNCYDVVSCFKNMKQKNYFVSLIEENDNKVSTFDQINLTKNMMLAIYSQFVIFLVICAFLFESYKCNPQLLKLMIVLANIIFIIYYVVYNDQIAGIYDFKG
jgi:hypothetical protein